MVYKVCIIIPIFNVESYLENALNSIIKQTMNLSDIQVILVDDKSTDNSSKIIDKYSKRYDNFYPIYLKENTGSASEPRNIALKHINAEYVMFLDPDDEFSEDYCEVMYNTIKKYNADLVKCNFINITNNGIFKKHYFNKNIDKLVITSSDEPLKLVAIWSGIHKPELIFKNNINFPHGFGEDIYFTVKEFLHIDKMIFLNNYFGYKYFDRPISHAKTASYENILNIINVFYLTNELCEKFQREDIIKIVLGQQIISVYSRIRNASGFNNKYILLKEVSILVNTLPKLSVPNTLYKIANSLVRKKLIYTTIVYFTIINILSRSKFLQKLITIIETHIQDN